VNPILDTFDDFVDDMLSSDIDLLKGELDFLIMQEILESFDLNIMKRYESKYLENAAA